MSGLIQEAANAIVEELGISADKFHGMEYHFLAAGVVIDAYSKHLKSEDMITKVAMRLWGDRHTQWEDAGKTAHVEYKKQARTAINAILEDLCCLSK